MNPTLRLISGNDSIELMNATGALYAGWTPSFTPHKSVYADSAMANERRLVFQKQGTAIETINLHVRAECQDDAIDILRRIELMLEEVRNYWTKPPSANIDPVYIKAKAANETNARYAIILDGRIDEHADPFRQPFFVSGKALIDSIVLLLERGQWSDKPPGESEAGTFLYSTSGLYDYLEYDDTGDYLNCGTNAVLENIVDGGFTVEGWFRFSGDIGLGYKTMGLVSHLKDGTPDKNWVFAALVNKYGNHGIGGTVFGSTNAHTTSWEANPPVFVPVGGWVYLAFIVFRDPNIAAVGNFRIRLVINGATAVTSDAGYTHVYDASQDLYVGNLTTEINGMYGDIKWVRISEGNLYTAGYVGNLTTDGVQHPNGYWIFYDYTPPDFCTPPEITSRTIAQWNMDEGTGATVDNAVGLAALDGTITNAAWAEEGGCGASNQEDIGGKAYIAGFDANVQITDAYRFDASGPSWSGNLIGSSLPYLLFPEPAATGDYLYIGNSGIDPATDGPFCSVIFDMDAQIDDGDWSHAAPYYWDGAAWTQVSDSGDETEDFHKRGVNARTWTLPDANDWVKGNLFTILGGTAPGVNGWWIRLGITVTSAPTNSPEQHNRDLYTANRSGIIVPEGTVVGDIGALCAMTLSQINGVYDSVVVGSRKVESGDPFVPFIHTTNNVHNHAGITISGDGTDAATTLWPSGEHREASLVGDGTDTVTITLDSSIAPAYAGKFRAFLVIGDDNTDFSEETFTLSYKINDVDIAIENKPVVLPDFGKFHSEAVTIDLGTVDLSQDPDDINQLIFDITVRVTGAGFIMDWEMYALALVPTDGDLFLDISNPATGPESKHVGWTGATQSFVEDKLVVDGVSSPLSGLSAKVRNVSDAISANYVVSSPSGMILPSGEFSLWFVFYSRERYEAGATDYDYRSGAHITNAVSYGVAQQYRLMRGSS